MSPTATDGATVSLQLGFDGSSIGVSQPVESSSLQPGLSTPNPALPGDPDTSFGTAWHGNNRNMNASPSTDVEETQDYGSNIAGVNDEVGSYDCGPA
jgi:hypothetical protein